MGSTISNSSQTLSLPLSCAFWSLMTRLLAYSRCFVYSPRVGSSALCSRVFLQMYSCYAYFVLRNFISYSTFTPAAKCSGKLWKLLCVTCHPTCNMSLLVDIPHHRLYSCSTLVYIVEFLAKV